MARRQRNENQRLFQENRDQGDNCSAICTKAALALISFGLLMEPVKMLVNPAYIGSGAQMKALCLMTAALFAVATAVIAGTTNDQPAPRHRRG